MRLGNKVRRLSLVVGLAMLALTTYAKVLPPNASFAGKSLAGWLKTYWVWYYSSQPDSGQVGKVVLLPLPEVQASENDFTYEDPGTLSGHADVTIKAGTSFVLPLIAWTGEIYTDGSQDDPLPDALFGDPSFISGNAWLDGKPVITDANVRSYYVPQTFFDQVIYYGEPTDYGSIGVVWFQSIGFVCDPLPVGTHQVRLRSTGLIPDLDVGVIYENSWTITVTP